MEGFECGTVEVESSAWTSSPQGLEETLNQYASASWQRKPVLAPAFAGFAQYIIIFERIRG
jgi:hypothetical protein